jgi:hypothetical protein
VSRRAGLDAVARREISVSAGNRNPVPSPRNLVTTRTELSRLGQLPLGQFRLLDPVSIKVVI